MVSTAGLQAGWADVLRVRFVYCLDHDAGLPYAGLTDQGNNLTRSRRCSLPTVKQDGGVVVPPDERSWPRRVPPGGLSRADP